MNFEFTLYGRITDETALLERAVDILMEEGAYTSRIDCVASLKEKNEPDVINLAACLVAILDPSSGVGFEITESSAEVA